MAVRLPRSDLAHSSIGLLARPTASVGLARSGHAPIVLNSEFPGRGRAALFTQLCGSTDALAGFAQQIVGQGECGAKILTAYRRAVLGQRWRSLKDQIGIGNEVSERFQ